MKIYKKQSCDDLDKMPTCNDCDLLLDNMHDVHIDTLKDMSQKYTLLKDGDNVDDEDEDELRAQQRVPLLDYCHFVI